MIYTWQFAFDWQSRASHTSSQQQYHSRRDLHNVLLFRGLFLDESQFF
jgi:hypothetical protein